jgi:translocation protein SEC72
VYAFATIDGVMAVLWFSGWIAVASYVAQGKSEGASDQKDSKDKDKKSGCDAFAYGSSSKCTISTATVIFGVIIL